MTVLEVQVQIVHVWEVQVQMSSCFSPRFSTDSFKLILDGGSCLRIFMFIKEVQYKYHHRLSSRFSYSFLQVSRGDPTILIHTRSAISVEPLASVWPLPGVEPVASVEPLATV